MKAKEGFYNPPADGKPTRRLRDEAGKPIPPDGYVGDDRPDNKVVSITRKDPDPLPVKHDWQWGDLGEFADLPAAVHLVNGLLIQGAITLWYAKVKSGKSRMLMGLLAAMSPGGPKFCGMDLPETRTLLFTEEPPTVLGDRVRDYKVPPGMHIANQAAALALRPEVFAEEVKSAYDKHGRNFGLIAVDTIGAFVNCENWNDYTATRAAMAPLRRMLRDLPGVAILLLHHQNKAGGDEWNGALGSTGLAGDVEQIVRMARKGSQHQITVGGREKSDPFPYDEPVTISISSSGVEFVGTATEMAATLLTDYLGDEPKTITELMTAIGDDAPSDDIIRKALRAMVEDGKVAKTKGKGRKGDTYQQVV